MNNELPAVIIKRDSIVVRDNAVDDIVAELKKLLPDSLLFRVDYNPFYCGWPTIFIKNVKKKILWFKIYQTIAIVEFRPHAFESLLNLWPYDTRPEILWSSLEKEPGQLTATCYDPQLESSLVNALDQVSTKLKLKQPALIREGYDVGHLILQDFSSSKPSKTIE